MAGERQGKRTSVGEKVTGGGLDGVEHVMKDAIRPVLPQAKGVTRYILKKAPGAPGFVYDAAQIYAAKPEDKVRKIFGAAGGMIGAAGGGALGSLAGPIAPVAGPLGAAVGGAFGEDIGTDIYDRNKQWIDGAVHRADVAVHRAGEAWDDSWEAGQRRLEDTERWIKGRNAQLFGR